MTLVSQRFIDLLNMPVPALKRLAEASGIELPATVSKWDVARAVSSALSRDDLEDASDGFLYAGRTSMSWFRLVEAAEDEDDPELYYPLEGEGLDQDAVIAALTSQAEGDPFSEGDRPAEITSAPKLVLAREWRDGVLMTFAVAKRLTHVIHNFELVEVLEDEFFSAFLRPADGTFEVRASAARADRLYRAWLGDFAQELGLKAYPVGITRDDVRAIRDEINGRLAKYGGSESTGTSAIGAMTLAKADTCEDLFEEPEFDQRTEGYDPVAYDLLFNYEDGDDIRVHISPLQGSVFVLTSVSEPVIRYLYDSMRAAKT